MNILVSNASRDPIYEQISRQVRTQIVNGTLEAGDILPSIRALARELQVSVITTKRAYDDLEKEGFNTMEWYYLRSVDDDRITIEVDKLDLKLPSYAGTNEDISTFTVPIRGGTEKTGVFKVHGITIGITMSDDGTISAKIIE